MGTIMVNVYNGNVMTGLEFVKSEVDWIYINLQLEFNYPEDVAKAYVRNILVDLHTSFINGLRVVPIFMNPDGEYEFVDVVYKGDFLGYYGIAKRAPIGEQRVNEYEIPMIERNAYGIPLLYDTYELVNEKLMMYSDYFNNEYLEITGYQ